MDDYGWWAGSTEEFMNIGGPFASRDSAIEAGRNEQCGDPFWICEARLHAWCAPSATSVLDMMVDNSDEYFYDDCFDGFVGGKDAEKAAEDDLQAVLNEWFMRRAGIFPTPTAFSGTNALEQIDAPAPVASS